MVMRNTGHGQQEGIELQPLDKGLDVAHSVIKNVWGFWSLHLDYLWFLSQCPVWTSPDSVSLHFLVPKLFMNIFCQNTCRIFHFSSSKGAEARIPSAAYTTWRGITPCAQWCHSLMQVGTPGLSVTASIHNSSPNQHWSQCLLNFTAALSSLSIPSRNSAPRF